MTQITHVTKEDFMTDLRQHLIKNDRNLFVAGSYGGEDSFIQIAMVPGWTATISSKVWNSVKADPNVREVNNGIKGHEFADLPTTTF